ncbi:MAG: hypothetical protein [Microviridae sp.]|nr:MAG: hypothetical protein [Microviridae sp.]
MDTYPPPKNKSPGNSPQAPLAVRSGQASQTSKGVKSTNHLDILVLIDTSVSAETYEAMQNDLFKVQQSEVKTPIQLCLFTN